MQKKGGGRRFAMILKWIQSMGSGATLKASEQGDEEERKARRDSKLIDVAHEALIERAANDHATLKALAKLGMHGVKREQFKGKVRKKVFDVVSEESGFPADEGMIEEITERIVDAADADPFYKKLFDPEEKPGKPGT